jgi:hypothetical protein
VLSDEDATPPQAVRTSAVDVISAGRILRDTVSPSRKLQSGAPADERRAEPIRSG